MFSYKTNEATRSHRIAPLFTLALEAVVQGQDTSYAIFIQEKAYSVDPVGFDPATLPSCLKPFQRDSVRWALRMGRAALFLDTGLGKTLIQLVWADAIVRHTQQPVLILAPLAVGPQTVREAEKFGIDGVKFVYSQEQVSGVPSIYVTNYEKLHKFDSEEFVGIVLDESGILKSHDGKTRTALIDAFANTPYRLACTATPSPNDHEELGNHCQFLGVMSRVEMLATFFVHDSMNTSEWRLKGHAEGEFWRWVASWALVARRPSDLGHEDEDYDLPKLTIEKHYISTGAQEGRLIPVPERTLTGQRQARRKTMNDRVELAAKLAKGKDHCIVWCELNDEGDAVTGQIHGAVQVAGANSDDEKVDRLTGFAEGRYKKLVSKGKIAGFGMNFQICHKMVFVGLSNSYEQFYQMLRRCWRYGQEHEVIAHVITSDLEESVLENIEAKQKKHEAMIAGMLEYTREVNRASLQGTQRMSDEYETDEASGDGWRVMMGDCVERVKELEDNSVDYSIFSPPFADLYVYSNSPRDMGNCKGEGDFANHLRFLTAELYRVIKPGRLLSFHCMNLPTQKGRQGYIGISDFRGDLIRMFQSDGFIYHSEVCIWKDPVTAMQRTKALGLLHKQVKKDSCMSRQGIADYVVTMRKPGVNEEPVDGKFDLFVGTDGPDPIRIASESEETRFSVEVWQRYASPVWMDINPTRVLAYADARDEKDQRHVCPLQLDVIDRCIDLWSNPGDLILSPFAGVGSELHEAVKMGRRAIGVELKRSYFQQAVNHLRRAEKEARNGSLFDFIPEEVPA